MSFRGTCSAFSVEQLGFLGEQTMTVKHCGVPQGDAKRFAIAALLILRMKNITEHKHHHPHIAVTQDARTETQNKLISRKDSNLFLLHAAQAERVRAGSPPEIPPVINVALL
ncbi:UNVERIFIED_CONTAM: hypothetical protein FKN15_045231 [Acipenser sinensis]